MYPKSAFPLRSLSKFVLVTVLVTAGTNWAAAASTSPINAGSGSMDDWLAMGLAMLAALYCVQKRE